MTLHKRLLDLPWSRRLRSDARPVIEQETPLRAELFGAEQMEHHGTTLASAHTLGPKRRRDPLLPRLAENEGVLTDTCALLTTAIKAERPYRLNPGEDEGTTLVTQYYDWSEIHPEWKERNIFPILSELALRATLGCLERTVRYGLPAGLAR